MRIWYFMQQRVKVPATLTWNFTDDLSNFALVVFVFAEVFVVLDELASFVYLELPLDIVSPQITCGYFVFQVKLEGFK